MFQALNPRKKLIWDRVFATLSTENSRKWTVLPPVSDATSVTTVLGSIGRTFLGIDPFTSTNISTASTWDSYVQIHGKCFVEIRNVSNHNCVLDVYVCEVREDMSDFNWTDTAGPPLITAIQKYAAYLYAVGIDYQANTAEVQEGGEAGVGTIIDYDKTINSFADLGECTPYLSTEFCQAFHIMSKQKVELLPGQSYKGKLKARMFKWSATEAVGSSIQDDDIAFGNGVTRFVMIGQRGVMGKGNADDTKVGYMKTALAINMKFIYDSVPHSVTKKSIATRLTDRVDITGVTLEAPTNVLVKDHGE